jgi:hypothetical protein
MVYLLRAAFILTNPGGFRVIGGGTVLLPDYSSAQKKTVKQNLNMTENTALPSILTFVVAVKKWIEREHLLAFF